VTVFAACSTFGLYLVYTWFPTFLYDKFSFSMARAGFEASIYPQMGTLGGLLAGGALADRYYRRFKAARFCIILAAFVTLAPCDLPAREQRYVGRDAGGRNRVRVFAGFIIGNQAPAAFDVVPPSLRASTIGILNMLGSAVSGLAPFLGGLARRTVGVHR